MKGRLHPVVLRVITDLDETRVDGLAAHEVPYNVFHSCTIISGHLKSVSVGQKSRQLSRIAEISCRRPACCADWISHLMYGFVLEDGLIEMVYQDQVLITFHH